MKIKKVRGEWARDEGGKGVLNSNIDRSFIKRRGFDPR